MGCSTCTTQKQGLPKGCKSNGACSLDGCNKLTVFNWLSNMSLPDSQKPFNIVEIRFKNGRKLFYKNIKNLSLCIGDVVAVETAPGHDVGTITLTGELVKIQLRKKGISLESEDIKQIYRKATQKDIDVLTSARDKEEEVKRKSRLIITKLGLKMKLSDVEYQGDGSKAIFYYTADERVDFRILIRELASLLRVRIEMKQIRLRQEAARLGGIGSCGRELCCSTWLTDFASVSTSAARYQQLSLNPQKLAGQCGKLKCCLNYELDVYLDALKDFPTPETTLLTENGVAIFQKMDIFKGMVWYSYKENPINWHKIGIYQIKEIISLNKQNKKAHSLEIYSSEIEEEEDKNKTQETIFANVVGQDSLNRFDKPKRKKKKRKNFLKNEK